MPPKKGHPSTPSITSSATPSSAASPASSAMSSPASGSRSNGSNPEENKLKPDSEEKLTGTFGRTTRQIRTLLNEMYKDGQRKGALESNAEDVLKAEVTRLLEAVTQLETDLAVAKAQAYAAAQELIRQKAESEELSEELGDIQQQVNALLHKNQELSAALAQFQNVKEVPGPPAPAQPQGRWVTHISGNAAASSQAPYMQVLQQPPPTQIYRMVSEQQYYQSLTAPALPSQPAMPGTGRTV